MHLLRVSNSFQYWIPETAYIEIGALQTCLLPYFRNETLLMPPKLLYYSIAIVFGAVSVTAAQAAVHDLLTSQPACPHSGLPRRLAEAHSQVPLTIMILLQSNTCQCKWDIPL